MACIHGDARILEVLNLLVLAPPSRFGLKIGAWLVVMEISKRSEFAGVGSIRRGWLVVIEIWLVVIEICKSSEFVVIWAWRVQLKACKSS